MRLRVIDGWLVSYPETRAERRRGLLGRDAIDEREALVLPHCRSVHTIGMRLSIDVVMLDRRWRPILTRAVRPGHIMLPHRGTGHIVEVAAGQGPAFSAALAGRTTRDALRSDRRGRVASPDVLP